ncbi:MAG TPA: fumarylacetoacetate hydrolase family protein [Eoetvoesiella sp.]
MVYVIQAPEIVAVPVDGSADKFPVRRVYCVGRNYAAHAREMGFNPDREPPFFFCKPADAVTACEDDQTLLFPYPPESSNVHYEIELVVAIGKGGANIKVGDALEHVWGYAIGLDMTRRDRQIEMRDVGRPWELGKAFDESAPIGAIHPVSQVGHLQDAEISLTVNGVKKQRGRTSQLIWPVAETISYLSRYFKLMPGDLIYTGTPEGVGPVVAGDLMEGAIDGLGTLSVEVV